MGYVEPVPGLYRSLSEAAARLQTLYVEADGEFGTVTMFFEHWMSVMGQLDGIANVELAGGPMSEVELEFLNQTVRMGEDQYLGYRIFTGWYPQLYWERYWDPDPETYPEMASHDSPSGLSEPLVADVHTDAEKGRVLEVATSHPGLMIVAIDAGGTIALYGGPVSSYYAFHQPIDQRMTDEDWLELVDAGELPPRPAFAESYWAE